MNAKTKEELKNTIKSETIALANKIQILQQQLEPVKKSCAYDDAEYAFLCNNYKVKEREIERLQQRYEELETALSRIKSPSYGICEECEEEIELERLHLSPNAKICTKCLKNSRD